jgi:hypothetical protein
MAQSVRSRLEQGIRAWKPGQEDNVAILIDTLMRRYERYMSRGRMTLEDVDRDVESKIAQYGIVDDDAIERMNAERKHYTIDDVKRVIVFESDSDVQEIVPDYIYYNKEIYENEKSKLEAQIQATLDKVSFTQEEFEVFATNAKKTILRSFSKDGLSIGIIAAQSMGEKSSQIIFNTFHRAGVGSAQSILQSGDVVEELMRNAKEENVKNPLSYIYLKKGTLDEAMRMHDLLEHVTLNTLAINNGMRYIMRKTSDEDIERLALNDILYGQSQAPVYKIESTWIIRIFYTKAKVASKELTPDEICKAINAVHGAYAVAIKGSFESSYIDVYLKDSATRVASSAKTYIKLGITGNAIVKPMLRDDVRLLIQKTTIRGLPGVDIVAPIDSNLNAYIISVDDGHILFNAPMLKSNGITDTALLHFVSMHLGAKDAKPASASISCTSCGTMVSIDDPTGWTKKSIRHALHTAENVPGRMFIAEDGTLNANASFYGFIRLMIRVKSL